MFDQLSNNYNEVWTALVLIPNQKMRCTFKIPQFGDHGKIQLELAITAFLMAGQFYCLQLLVAASA
jgi:hypothetical protein